MRKPSKLGRNLASRFFPNLSIFSSAIQNASNQHPRRATPPTVEQVLATFTSYGPPLARLAALGALATPLFSICLQRDTFEIGGNAGALTLGALPHEVNESAMTWVDVRAYSPAQGGLVAPAESPQEVWSPETSAHPAFIARDAQLYPLAWEIPVDGVYFDGQKLPRSNLSSSALTLTALVDTVCGQAAIYHI
jgi:hypothetical protein